jgi:hypothetical protein
VLSVGHVLGRVCLPRFIDDIRMDCLGVFSRQDIAPLAHAFWLEGSNRWLKVLCAFLRAFANPSTDGFIPVYQHCRCQLIHVSNVI